MKQTNEVSKLAGISRRTLQYYDDEGVLLTKRSEHNYRIYDEEDLEKIWRLMIYKELGFDLKEIKELLTMSETLQTAWLQKQLDKYENNLQKIKEKMNFILLILDRGMPQLPSYEDGHTYKDCIAKLVEQDCTNCKL